jgi:hypothetical protein
MNRDNFGHVLGEVEHPGKPRLEILDLDCLSLCALLVRDLVRRVGEVSERSRVP